MKNKFIATIADALRQCGLADGMTLSFHHHLRNGDHVVNMTMDAVASLGIKNITVACSSMFPVHEHLVQHIKSGVITGIDTDYMSGPLARAITEGQLPTPVMFRSHGGRPRAIGEGSLKIDIAVIAAPAVDALGNINGSEGPSACGSLAMPCPTPSTPGTSSPLPTIWCGAALAASAFPMIRWIMWLWWTRSAIRRALFPAPSA